MNFTTNSHKIHARQARTTGKPHIPITEPAVGVAELAGNLKKVSVSIWKIDTFLPQN